jgi:hypothetical protein
VGLRASQSTPRSNRNEADGERFFHVSRGVYSSVFADR